MKIRAFQPLSQSEIEDYVKKLSECAAKLGFTVAWGEDRHAEYQSTDTSVYLRKERPGMKPVEYTDSWEGKPLSLGHFAMLMALMVRPARFQSETNAAISGRVEQLLLRIAAWGYKPAEDAEAGIEQDCLKVVHIGSGRAFSAELKMDKLDWMEREIECAAAERILNNYMRTDPSADIVILDDSFTVNGSGLHALRPEVVRKILPSSVSIMDLLC